MVKPVCPYFGACGGCSYQDIAYEEELSIKESGLKGLLQKEPEFSENVFRSIVPSPSSYGYRSRLDLSFRRVRGEMLLGFNSAGTRQHVAVDSCAIARPEISAFLPLLKQAALQRLPENYRSANLVVKTDGGGKVRWGGIGRGSLGLSPADYFWIEIEGKQIFYSLDTFFQANLGILPEFIRVLRSLLALDPETHLLDLYAGVGLFWVLLSPEAKGVWAVEESRSAVQLAEFNRRHHGFPNVFLKEGKTEECLAEVLKESGGARQTAVIDPPRQGLTPLALQKLVQAKMLDPLIYISCNPEALLRDLKEFLKNGWRLDQIVPFDFFPRTRHLEVVVRLSPGV